MRLAFAALGSLALVACHAAPPAPAGRRSITDGIGRAVALGAVRRVVSLAPSSTEIIFALGAGDALVGVDRYSDFPAAARALPQVGTDTEPSLERILGLKPDLVFVATSANAQGSVETMARAGLPVYVSRADSLPAIFADIEGIGRALDRSREASVLVAALRARIETVTARVRTLAPSSCAVVVWPSPLIVAARGSHVGDLLAAAGGRNVVEEATQAFPTYSTERLVKLAPEVLVVGTHSTGAPSLDPLLQLASVPAVRDKRVHLVDGDLLFRPGPRVVDGIATLVPLLHPELAGPAHAVTR